MSRSIIGGVIAEVRTRVDVHARQVDHITVGESAVMVELENTDVDGAKRMAGLQQGLDLGSEPNDLGSEPNVSEER